MDDNYQNIISEFEENIVTDIAKLRVDVLVLGPNLSLHKSGSKLRQFIIDKCATYGVAVKGEHERLREVYERRIKGGNNACSLELAAAVKVDAVVIIPDSAGSLVELGMFAMAPGICQKTLILFQEKYSDAATPSFVQLGPKIKYERDGAEIQYVNYRRLNVAWNIVDQFILKFRAIKFDQMQLKKAGA